MPLVVGLCRGAQTDPLAARMACHARETGFLRKKAIGKGLAKGLTTLAKLAIFPNASEEILINCGRSLRPWPLLPIPYPSGAFHK